MIVVMDDIKSQRAYRFVEEYAKDRNGTRAAQRAGYSPATANEQAARLLADPRVATLVEAECAKISRLVEFDAAEVLRQWVLIATADPAKIMKMRQLNCRHCWGIGHEHQWSAREYAKACEAAATAVDHKGNPSPKPPPPCDGGFGWVFNAQPNPECPECRGEGTEDLWLADMDGLGPAERRLIASVERTKDGLKVKMRDQDGAVRHIADYLGMIVKKQELTGKNGAPLHQPVDPSLITELAKMTPDQLRALARTPLKDE